MRSFLVVSDAGLCFFHFCARLWGVKFKLLVRDNERGQTGKAHPAHPSAQTGSWDSLHSVAQCYTEAGCSGRNMVRCCSQLRAGSSWLCIWSIGNPSRVLCTTGSVAPPAAWLAGSCWYNPARRLRTGPDAYHRHPVSYWLQLCCRMTLLGNVLIRQNC